MPSTIASGIRERIARAEVERNGGVVDRPAGPGVHFGLSWVRTGPGARGGPPVLVVPGGPGLASVLPYRGLRRRAAAHGLDLIMVEHRGLGLSRRDAAGDDLASEQVTVRAAVDDLAAALDDAGVRRAVVHGTSYGTYLAQAFGARHPDRVAGMVLDSPMLAVEDDLAAIRAYRRRLLWDGGDPATARAARWLRALVTDGIVSDEQASRVVPLVHEFAGPAVLERLLAALRRGRGRRTWDAVARIGAGEVDGPGTAFVYEPDPVRGIAYRELGYGLPPDGGPLDPQVAFERAARASPDYAGEPFDLVAELPRFGWPLAVVSGDRDLRAPRPVAERIVALAPDAVLVPLRDTGHSATDTHPVAALAVADVVARGGHRSLPALAPRIAALSRRGASRLLGATIAAGVRAELLLPRR